jgi:hypothetical protein
LHVPLEVLCKKSVFAHKTEIQYGFIRFTLCLYESDWCT